MADIEFNIAINNFNENNNNNFLKYKNLIEEVKDIDLSMVDSLDLWSYASDLNKYNPDKNAKKYTANDIRRMNQRSKNDYEALLNSFENDETDEIFDFF